MQLENPIKVKTIKLNSLNIKSSLINSASSLISVKNRIFACCDDQYTLYELIDDNCWIQHKWKDAPDLPIDLMERKKVKPDFEALLGPVGDGNTLFLIPSGSKKNRTKALKFNLLDNQFSILDFKKLFDNLTKQLENLNIEGSVFFEEKYIFMNRGVQLKQSSLVTIDPTTFVIKSIDKIDFGLTKGVRLHGSELCVFEDCLYALAVAENSSNSYDDGEIVGSVLFKLSLKPGDCFRIIDQWDFDKIIKLEGLCRWHDNWLVATDPDGFGLSEFFNFKI